MAMSRENSRAEAKDEEQEEEERTQDIFLGLTDWQTGTLAGS